METRISNFLPFHVHEANHLMGMPAAEREQAILQQQQARAERLNPAGIAHLARKLGRRMDAHLEKDHGQGTE